jgi:hypothetical protein
LSQKSIFKKTNKMSQTNTVSPSPKKAMAAATTTPTINKNLVITNNSSVALAIIDALASDDTQVVFEQNLKLLPTTTGAQSIAANGSGTVVLDDSHNNAGVPTYTKLYDIIYAKSDTLFPVISLGSILNHTTQDYAPVTITTEEVTAMKQTELFTQTIASYPTAQLAQNFAAALQATTNDATGSNNIDDKVAAFFASTQQFQQVTLDSIIALKSYYNTYPIVWTDYKSSKTYYFYSSNGTTVTANGSLAINVPATVSLDKTLPGFTFTYTDANNTTKQLFYANGQFVDDPKLDVPNICLAGTFVVKSTLTKVDTDTMIISVLSGNIYDNQVLGYDTPLTRNSDGSGGGWSGLYTLLHPKDAQGWMQLFLTFIGLTMGIDFVAKALKSFKDKLVKDEENLGDAFSPATVEADRTSAKENSGLNDPKYKLKMEKIKAGDAASKSLPDQMKDGDAKYQDRLTEDWRTATDAKLGAMSDMLQQMLDSGHATTQMENADDALEGAYTSVDSPSTADLSNQIAEVNQSVEGLRTTITQQFDVIINKLKGTVQDALNKAKAEADDVSKKGDNVAEDLDKAKSGDTPTDAEPENSGIED